MYTRPKLLLILLISFVPNQSYAQLSTINSFGRVLSNGYKEDVGDFNLVVPVIDTIKQNKLNSVSLGELKKSRNLLVNVRLPLKEIITTSAFGFRYHPIYREVKFHLGVDLKAFYEPVYAFSSGKVEKVSYDTRSGYSVVIDHGRRIKTAYAHLSYIGVYEHQEVTVGSVIAVSGNTGVSTSPHLHFSITYGGVPVDPTIMFNYLQ